MTLFTVSVDPELQNAKYGQTVYFVCYGASVNWTLNGKPLSSKPIVDENSNGQIIKIPAITLEDAGTYTCTGINRNGEPIKENGILIVEGKCLLFLWNS